jgi:hypothetical protein
MKTPSPPQTLNDLPLWRLFVMLDDAERVAGSDSETARVLARVIRERLHQEPPSYPPPHLRIRRE